MEKSDLLSQLRIDHAADRASRVRTRLLVVMVVALLVGGGLTWRAAVWAHRPTVQTVEARSETPASPVTSVLDASGYVTARRQATVSAKITGKVIGVYFEEGMQVEEGAVLARLDDTDAKAQVALTRAQLTAVRTQVAEIRAQLQQAERDHARQQELYDRRLVSPQTVDATLTQRDVLRARLATAEDQINVAQESVTVAQVQLDNTVIRAPFSGVVVAKSAQPGEMISPLSAGGSFTRTGIGTIVDMDSLEIHVDVNEAYINRFAPRQPVDALLNAYPTWRIPCEVIAIIPAADRSKATVKVRIAIKSRDPRIVPDMGVRVGFLSGPRGRSPDAPGVLVPADAVRVEGKQGIVFVYAGDRVERRIVTLGPVVEGQRRVTTGLRAGERVVVAPPDSLKDGDRVKLGQSG
jgi:RND family efflux transporter MFP subunit